MARILLIDDDDSLRTMLGLYLTGSGHTVIEARDGEEGLELFPQTAADLVITDMMMPKKNGFEVLRTLKEKQPAVRVIAISGGGRPGTEHPLVSAQALGVAGVLAKPFTLERLKLAITEALTVGNGDIVIG